MSFTYNGPTLTTDTTFSSFTLTSVYSDRNTAGFDTGQDAKNVGLDIGTKIGSVGNTTVVASAVPEPSSMILVGVGLVGAAALSRRRRQVG